jgi:DNA modification methylase/uncharacterized ParB-like nuclease family protein
MKLPITSIIVDDKDQVEKSDEFKSTVQGLAESIKERGLSHPIIVRPANIEGSEKYFLVSGEKRLLAIQSLGETEIEATVKEVDEINGKILRLHENLKRNNLPWFEQALLVENLHTLRQQEHGGQLTQGRPKKDEGKKWGIRETAEELGRALGPLSEDIQLARAVQLNPALRNVSDRKTAVRLVRIAAQRHNSEIEAKMPTEASYDEAFFGDSASVLKSFPDKTFDHCVTDPPWIKFFDPSLILDQRTLPVFREVYRVLKNNSFLLFFCGLDDYHYYCGYDAPDETGAIVHNKGQLERIGFNVSKTPAIWQKENALSRRGVRSWEYDRDFEFVVVAVKGSPVMVSPTAISAFKRRPITPVAHLRHPNEKPTAVVEDFIKDISFEGNLILDPFGGSFVTAEACKNLNRRYVVIERDPASYKKGCERLGKKG